MNELSREDHIFAKAAKQAQRYEVGTWLVESLSAAPSDYFQKLGHDLWRTMACTWTMILLAAKSSLSWIVEYMYSTSMPIIP
ncbi:hypothetical protein BGX34_009801 [Mortierella sp. NVP85]|nr:hypothetical protein BGX34_009801 [Mortierella sp. NVP85]